MMVIAKSRKDETNFTEDIVTTIYINPLKPTVAIRVQL